MKVILNEETVICGTELSSFCEWLQSQHAVRLDVIETKEGERSVIVETVEPKFE